MDRLADRDDHDRGRIGQARDRHAVRGIVDLPLPAERRDRDVDAAGGSFVHPVDRREGQHEQDGDDRDRDDRPDDLETGVALDLSRKLARRGRASSEAQDREGRQSPHDRGHDDRRHQEDRPQVVDDTSLIGHGRGKAARHDERGDERQHRHPGAPAASLARWHPAHGSTSSNPPSDVRWMSTPPSGPFGRSDRARSSRPSR